MECTPRFQQKKFKRFSKELQHKKCAELLREVYVEMTKWMHDEKKAPDTLEELANQYHYHLEKAHQNVKEHHLLPRVQTGDRKEAAAPFLPICIYLDKLRSVFNVGNIIRTTEALRLGTVVLSEYMDVTHPSLEKTAMGTTSLIHCQKATPLDQLPRPLIAVETIHEAIPYYDFTFPNSFTLAFGNEELGLSKETLEAADHYIQIPLYGCKNSINVASAFAIVAAEIARQKRK